MITYPAEDLERHLCARTVPGLFPEGTAGEFVLPEYACHSLANIAATMGELLQAPLKGVSPPLDEAYWGVFRQDTCRVVLVLLDALGYLQLRQMLGRDPDCAWGRLAGQGLLLPMTSIVPSTTDTALATLLTGTEPIAHGLLGYELWLREWGILTEMLSLKPAFGNDVQTLLDWGFVPEDFLPVPGLGMLLAQQGVRSVAIVPAPFTRGALTRMCYRGFDRLYGYASLESMWAIARHWLDSPESQRSLCYMYWGGIDSAIHAHGADENYWVQQFRYVTRAFEQQFLAELTPQEREGTLFIMIADHGFVDTPESLAHDTDTDAVFRRMLVVPYSGEARAAYLHCFDGDDGEAQRTIQDALGAGYVVLRTKDAVAAGLFGTGQPAPESLARLGHLFVIPRGAHYLDRRNLRRKLRGRHGGLSPEEMLVPWLAARLDA